MPTPESAAFLARKPTVPPTFSGVNYDDNARLKAAQDAVIREQWVKCMMTRLIREELGKCYRREGVAHLEKCSMLRGMFDSSEERFQEWCARLHRSVKRLTWSLDLRAIFQGPRRRSCTWISV